MEERYRREYEIIKKTGEKPLTASDIWRALDALGIAAGAMLMMHVSLGRVGWIVGGGITLLRSVMERVGQEGLLVMPAHSNDLGDPADWENPPVPEAWKPIIRREMPPFDPLWSTALRVGKTAEFFRLLPGVHRSSHPLFSLAAWGNAAEEFTASHPLNFPHGAESPLAKLYAHNAQILLYGVDFANCTLLHLAEYWAKWPGKEEEAVLAPVGGGNAGTRWQEFKDYSPNDDDFQAIGEAFEKAQPRAFRKTQLGFGQLIMAESRSLIDFAVQWMEKNRGATSGAETGAKK